MGLQKRLSRSFDVDTVTSSELGEYLREWKELFDDDEEEPKFSPQVEKDRTKFWQRVEARISQSDPSGVAKSRFWFLASFDRGIKIALVPGEYISKDRIRSAVDQVKARTVHRPSHVAVVVANSHETRLKSLATIFGTDIIILDEVEAYLRRFANKAESKKARLRTKTTATQIKANADAIENIVKSLAAQIDAKLEALKDTHGINDPDVIEARTVEIGEFERIRAKVATLERAVTKLKQPKSNTAPAVKAGKDLNTVLLKWMSKSASKHLDSVANMGIISAGAGLLYLLGVPPLYAAGMATLVVSGKSVGGIIRGGSGH